MQKEILFLHDIHCFLGGNQQGILISFSSLNRHSGWQRLIRKGMPDTNKCYKKEDSETILPNYSYLCPHN